MIKECLPKVGIQLLKISYVCQDIIPCFLTFCSSDQSLLSFLNFKFLNILVYVAMYTYMCMLHTYIQHYMHIHTYIHIYTHIYVCVYVCVCICMCVCKGYNMVRRNLPDIYARCPRARSTRGSVCIYQANPN